MEVIYNYFYLIFKIIELKFNDYQTAQIYNLRRAQERRPFIHQYFYYNYLEEKGHNEEDLCIFGCCAGDYCRFIL